MRGGRLLGACAAVLAVGALAGCGSSGSSGATGTAPAGGGPLEGRWELSGYSAGGTMTTPAPGVTADIVFTRSLVSGRAPVNQYSGPYTAGTGGALTIGPVARTQMAGPPAANAAETAYFAALEATRSYTSASGALTLRDAGGGTVLTFREAVPSIAGRWAVTGYNNGRQAVVSVAAGSRVTADFGTDGTVSGEGGVNTYHATYETTPARGADLHIRISPPATTRKAGPEALMRQEQEYLAALESARVVTFQGRDVTLRDASDAIAVTLTPR